MISKKYEAKTISEEFDCLGTYASKIMFEEFECLEKYAAKTHIHVKIKKNPVL